MRLFAFIAVVVSLTAQPVLAQDRPELNPSSNWLLDYAEDSCALRRTFGEEGSKVLLEMRQFAPDNRLQLMVSSADMTYRDRRLSVQFLPDDTKPQRQDVTAVESDDWGAGFLLNTSVRVAPDGEAVNAAYWDPAERDEREAAITGIFVDNAFRSDLVLRTGSLAKPMKAMRECVDNLITHWGLEPETQRTLLRPATPKNYRETALALVKDGYPDGMVRTGEQTAMRIRMTVDENGKGTMCKAQLNLGNELFERTACGFLSDRLEFHPALDRNGEAVASYWTISIVYRMN